MKGLLGLALFLALQVQQGHGTGLSNSRSTIYELDENEVELSSKKKNAPIISKGRISCLSCSPPHCEDFKVCHNAYRCYTAHIRDVDGTESKSKGCTRNHQQTMLHCRSARYDGRVVHEKNGRSAQYVFDCCKQNMCNNGTEWPVLPEVPVSQLDSLTGKGQNSENSKTLLQIVQNVVLPICALILLVAVALVVMRKCHLKRMDKINKNIDFGQDPGELAVLRAHAVGDSTLQEYQKGADTDVSALCLTSGSGSGMPRLIKRTLAKEIELVETIGKGRYGEVWKGVWNGDLVAVKIFFSRDEESFDRETKIYSTVLLRHENILGYYGSDCTSRNSCTQHWLVTHYHLNGSLYDYLNRQESLSTAQTYTILMSALTGLVHLHKKIHGTQGKPAIAHRDVKSKNILVRNDGTCVIADFGLAVTQEATGVLDEHSNARVGTRRYMSPEVLDGSIESHKSIDAYKQGDIYSFALVMWEVLRRTRSVDNDLLNCAEDFALAYHADVGPDPSFEEMRKVVCTANKRPDIPHRWMQNQFMSSVCDLMRICWHHNPSVRHTGLRLKKSLEKLEPKKVSPNTTTRPIYVPPPTLSFSNQDSTV